MKTKLCIILLLISSILLSGCNMNPSASTSTTPESSGSAAIDWTLYGTWITSDGVAGDSVTLSVKGDLPITRTGSDELKLDILFPSTFRYSYESQVESKYVSISGKHDKLAYLVCPTYCYDKEADTFVFSYFALCPSEEYMIFTWGSNPGQYLVASSRSDVASASILDYFREFIDTFA